MTGAQKHLVDWKFWDDGEIREMLEFARRVKRQRWEFQGHLQGRTLVMIFQKTSTRTRVSFEAGMTELGGHAINLDWRTTNFTLSDVRSETRYLSRNSAFIMARLKNHSDLLDMVAGATVPVINGCCNLYHPCQAFADMLTIAEDRDADPRGARLTYIGAYNNVVNSLVSISAALGVELTLVCPIRDEEQVDEESRSRLLGLGVLTETQDAKAAVVDADYVYTDTWIDMEYFNDPVFAEEKERRCALMLPYQVNANLLAGSGAKIMHDMPMHIGFEITEEVAESERSIIYDQAENRLDAQKAILLTLRRQCAAGSAREARTDHLESWSRSPEQASAHLQGTDYLERSEGAPSAETATPFQQRVAAWMPNVFSAPIIASRVERGLRLLEEALELAQSVGVTEDQARRIARHVLSRPPGDVRQEIGGVLVTLAALCAATGIDMAQAGEDEIARCERASSRIARKQARKAAAGLTATPEP